MRCRACFLLCILVFPLYLWSFPIEKFHICTAANTRDWPTFFFLEESAKRSGIDLEIAGLGRPYLGNGSKIVYMSDYLDGLNDDEIVFFLDAFDTIIIKSKEELLESFLKIGHPLVISTEKRCGFIPERADEFDTSRFFPYLNSGGYVGYVWKLKEWIRDLQIDPTEDDQKQIMIHYLAHKDEYHLDSNCEIFLSLVELKMNEIRLGKKGEVFLLLEGTYPGVIHANDHTFARLIPIYKHFMKYGPRCKKRPRIRSGGLR